MNDMDCFIIHGNRDLIFRRENNFYIVYDPYELEFYKFNEFSAEIMYLISKEYSYSKIFDYFKNNYLCEEDEFKATVLGFLIDCPIRKSIGVNLAQLGLL